MPKQQAYVTIKDHKESFPNKTPCRLINPAKSNLGIVSKQILERINNQVRVATKLNQWRNTHAVIDWFTELKDKQSITFLIFDIVDFYPSITESLLVNALDFASEHIAITDQDRETIMHVRKSLLFDENSPWIKRDNSSLFDVTMGSYDGAEVCELVGLYILNNLCKRYNRKASIGLYRDDGLAALKRIGSRSADKIRKEFYAIFENFGLRITAQANLKIVNYLDITLDLANDKFFPYRKPDNPPLYIHVQSNHPPAIIKQLPKSINSRISTLACDSGEFNKAAPIYNKALQESGFSERLCYEPSEREKERRKNRPRKILWFNPPFSRNVKTNIGKHFLYLLRKHFHKGHIYIE